MMQQRTPEVIRAEKCARSKARNLERRSIKRAKAEERQVARDTRTPKQQLQLLDSRFGKGVGAIKERARLMAQIND